MTTKPFQVLFVCTANLCRSPMAEYIMRAELLKSRGMSGASEWIVTSAGSRAESGHPMHPDTVRMLAEKNFIDIDGFRTRRLVGSQIAEADLILTAELEHRAAVARLVPSSNRRLFTLRQAARLSRGLPKLADSSGAGEESGPGLLERLRLAQSRMQPVPPEQDNLADPIGRRISAFRTCAEQIQTDISTILNPAGTP